MNKFTIADIRSWEPCYDPGRYLTEDWSGDALDILRRADIPPEDRLWVVLRPEVIPEKTLHLLACDYAERALNREREAGREPDQRSWDAIAVKRQWVRGEATDAELGAAEAAAEAAVGAAERAAERAAVGAAVGAAERAAVGAAVGAAERDAALAAALAAERDAALAAALAAAWDAAWDAERLWQAEHTISVLDAAKGE